MQEKIIPNLFEMKFTELQSKGAECIADIDHVDMLIAQRHIYLEIAKDMIKCRNNNVDRFELTMANAYCELAEAIQDLIEFWGN